MDKSDVIPPRSPTPSERVSAAKLRARSRAGLPLSTEEATRLHDYEKDRGESRSASRKVSYTEEETAAQAMGTGAAATEAASAAAMTREDGRRLDSILTIGVSALQSAFDRVLKSNDQILRRNSDLEEAQIRMMDAVRVHYIARSQAEGDSIIADAERAALDHEEKDDPISKMAGELLPMLLPQLMAAMAGGKK